MSSLLAGSMSLATGLLLLDDVRLYSEQRSQPGVALLADRPFQDAMLWPRSRWMGGEMGMGMLTEDAAFTGRYQIQPIAGGGNQQVKIRGVTRDSSAAPLGSCTVQAFLTATAAYVGQVVSDTGGYFEMPTPYVGQQHYLVAYKGGGPDVAGTTLNTLTPS